MFSSQLRGGAQAGLLMLPDPSLQLRPDATLSVAVQKCQQFLTQSEVPPDR